MSFLKIKVRGIIIQENKLFLCELKNERFYCLPGGTLEKGETLKQCLQREIYEELGIKAILGKQLYTQEFFDTNGNTTIDFWFEILNTNDFNNIELSTTSHGFELEKVGFYDIQNRNINYKPNALLEILKELNLMK